MPAFIPRFLLFFSLLCLALAPATAAERKAAVGTAPPQPVDMNLKVRREAKTEIPLQIIGKAGEPLKYLIRVPPEHGRLSEPRPTEREVSVVDYEPPADLAITTDKFSYAVQNSIGVSAAVDVNITIVDEQPQLAFPDALNFAKIRAGATNYRMLEISNHGGLIASGEIFVDPPWKIVGKNGYRLRAGDVAVFKVTFAPETGGEFEGVARYTSEPEHSTTLRGTAVAAISADPARWVLQQAPGDPTRNGSFELSSDLDEPRTVHLQADERLKIPAEVTLAAHGTATVYVEATSADVQGYDTEIHLASSDLAINVPVQVPALQAIVRATTPAIIFGRLPSGPEASAPFELENIGGTSGVVSWEVSPPFKVTENSTTLQPGEKKSFTVEIDTTVVNRYRTWLHFKVGAQSFDLPVEAEIVAGHSKLPAEPARRASNVHGTPAPTPGSQASPTPSPEDVKAALLALRDSLSPDMLPIPPPPKGVRVEKITSSGAVIKWPATLSPASQFRIEMRHMGPGPDHKMQITWAKVDGVAVEIRPPNYAVTLKYLPAAQPRIIRIRPLKGNGEVGDPIFTVTFMTLEKTSFRPHFGTSDALGLLVAALVGLACWQIWDRTRQRSAF